ncbi:hypothetical protein HS088_TW04G01328 [Tripterygium wilfordii]|uniref:Uncharacterized protein n=1 Tax=Tripterygium wilfordii TaxID=458696 RepID=A0A7J7DSL5_TRIWF|nr:hypothetical protein HS088_TW04G01328 [Tripterygium wilfordii]
MELDLSSMASVRKFASGYMSSGLPLNLLMHCQYYWQINAKKCSAGNLLISSDMYFSNYLSRIDVCIWENNQPIYGLFDTVLGGSNYVLCGIASTSGSKRRIFYGQ